MPLTTIRFVPNNWAKSAGRKLQSAARRRPIASITTFPVLITFFSTGSMPVHPRSSVAFFAMIIET